MRTLISEEAIEGENILTPSFQQIVMISKSSGWRKWSYPIATDFLTSRPPW